MDSLVLDACFEDEYFAIGRDHAIVRNMRKEKGTFDIYKRRLYGKGRERL